MLDKKQKKYLKFNIKNKKLLLIVIGVLCAVIISTFATTGIVKYVNYKKAESMEEISYFSYDVNGREGTVLVTFAYKDGIEKITDFENHTVYCHGRTIVGIDYKLTDRTNYKFKMEYSDGVKKDLNLAYEIPRIKGNYVLKNGIYINEPDISTGFNKEKTRYLYLDNEGTLVPGNWLTGDEPNNWYDYTEKNWANIYTEDNGNGSYFVWIPRYCYKKDTENSVSGNERMDIKFINTYNEYWDVYGNITTWDELEAQGYKIPEAFVWTPQYNKDKEAILPGYWMSKYQLTDAGTNDAYIVEYSAFTNGSSIQITNVKANTDKTVAKYTYAINGQIDNSVTSDEGITFENAVDGYNYINVTALDEQGRIIGSMTKTFSVTYPNAPDISSFNPETTFYAYWDEDGTEHSDIPISEEAPSQWYDYSKKRWANIVTTANGTRNYLVWIPRYQYKLDARSETSDILFIKGTSTDIEAGYQIPEAFWWDNNGNGVQDEGEQLTGYWMSKYQLSD